MPKCQNKAYIDKYIKYLEFQLAEKQLVYASAKRSLHYALEICDYFSPDVKKATTRQFEKWFAEQLTRKAYHNAGTSGVKKTPKKIGVETQKKIMIQTIKFLKFINFLDKNKPVVLFNSKKASIPEVAEFWIVNTKKNKTYEKVEVKQEKIKEVIDYLFSTGNYLDEMLGVLVSFLNDSGCRFGESCTLLEQDITVEGEYLIVKLRESKTATRTLSLLLCKETMKHWLRKFPNKGKNGLVFCQKDGSPVSYDKLRFRFKEVLTQQKIEWAKYKAFHYLRSLTATRFNKWDSGIANFWFGWADRSMRRTYSQYSYKDCQKQYLKTLKEEKNPMLDAKLSILDENIKDQKEALIDMVRSAVKKEMEITNQKR